MFVDAALPFGLRSAPKFFNVVADVLEWIMVEYGSCQVLHYLDDFLFVGEPQLSDCADTIQMAQEVCRSLGVRTTGSRKDGGPVLLSDVLGYLPGHQDDRIEAARG